MLPKHRVARAKRSGLLYEVRAALRWQRSPHPGVQGRQNADDRRIYSHDIRRRSMKIVPPLAVRRILRAFNGGG